MDIAMCSGNGCELKEGCYRYTAKPSMFQHYFAVSPIENNKCEYKLNK